MGTAEHDASREPGSPHPRRVWLISTVLGWGDLRDDAAVRGFIRTHPFVAFRPAPTSPG
jgi:hypothetical protein